ncbi:APC family permease [Streptomyces sp. CS081A]|uniref:APC family permease n=1 Tax=Streptomyces sp. CS081A TaxID=2162709 RepID=UPI000D51D043|nr:APC family permease [Streptomyces sp. CS081A]PVC76117.1 amino acid transporter [Streptomyces sp. CS081A]
MTDLSKTGHAEAPGGEAGSDDPLHRGLGVSQIVFMVVAAAAPLGLVAGGVPLAFAVSGSPGMPLYFALSTVLLLVFAVGFTLMAGRVRDAGAFYAYVQAGLGRIPGLSAATLALFSYTLLLVGVNAYVGVATSNVVERYADVGSPWWAWALVSLGVIAFLGHRDIELSAKVLGAVLVLESLLLLVLDLGIMGHGGAHGLTAEPVSPSIVGTGSPGLGVMFALFGFIGFEATAVFRNEAKDPDATVPRATYVAILMIGVFYAFTVWAIVVGVGVDAVVGAAQADPEGLVLTLTRSYVGPVWADAMQLLLITSQFACVLAFHNVVTRYQFALSRAGALPASLGVVHPRHRAPSASSAVASAIAFVTTLVVASLGLDPIGDLYAWFSGAATLGIVLLMAATSLAVIGFFRRADGRPSVWRTVVAPGVAFLGLACVVCMMVTNFPLLVGTVTGAWVIGGLVALSAVAGAVQALVLRARRPAVYERL